MSQYWALQLNTDSHLPSEYAALHQQRLYLLDSLAKQEARGERLANLLEAVKVTLSVAEPAEEGRGSKKALKKSLKTLAYKMTACQKTEKALADNLALLIARMNLLEQNQWRMASADYNQFTKYGQLDGLATSMQNIAVVSPMTPTFPITPGYSQVIVSPMTPMHPWPSFAPPSESYHLFSPTPMLVPYSSMPYVSQNPGQRDTIFEGFDETMQVDTVMSPLNLAAEEFVPADRALSLPNIDQSRRAGTVEGDCSGLTRKLSLANRGSAALRLQKMSP